MREAHTPSDAADTPRFRRAEEADVPAIVALVESAYRGVSSRAGWTTEADLLDGQRTDADEVRAILADPRARIVLATDAHGALLGCVKLEDGHGPNTTTGDGGSDARVEASGIEASGIEASGAAWIGLFAVNPTLQARGLGRALLAEAERLARTELGRRTARMTVIAQRDVLLAWYARCGYAPTGATEPFPYGNPRAGLPRRPDLYFVVLEKRLR
jgi:ribosomal protein S18 acetylase RimI-like enzyme